MSCALTYEGGSHPAYEHAFTAAPTPLAFARKAGAEFRVERINAAFARCFELPPASRGLPLSRVFRGASGDQLRRALDQCLEDQASVQLRIAYDSNGELGLFQVETRPVAAGGADLALISVQGPRAPSSLASLGEAGVLAEIGGLSHGLVFIHDVRRGMIRCTEHPLQKRLGLVSGSMPAARAMDVIDPADRGLVWRMLRRQIAAADGEVIQYACRLRTAPGELLWAHIRSQVFSRSADSKVQRILAVATDETERHRQEARRVAAERALAEAEVNERRRIGRELHDATAQLLLAARLGLNALASREAMSQDSLRILDEVRTAIDGAQREIRNFAFVLHPPTLLEEGLEEALRAFTDGFGRRTGLRICLELGGRRWRLPFTAKLALFRVAQEALMNVYRHAGATTAVVRLGQHGRRVVLEVQDDGVGLPHAADQREGVGVSGMRARVAQAGGVFELASTPAGVLVRASVPAEPLPRRIGARSVRRALASVSGPNPILEQGSA